MSFIWPLPLVNSLMEHVTGLFCLEKVVERFQPSCSHCLTGCESATNTQPRHANLTFKRFPLRCYYITSCKQSTYSYFLLIKTLQLVSPGTCSKFRIIKFSVKNIVSIQILARWLADDIFTEFSTIIMLIFLIKWWVFLVNTQFCKTLFILWHMSY